MMPSKIVDACCLINLYASGRPEAMLRAFDDAFFLPDEVRAEALYIRRHDENDPSVLVPEAIDLSNVLRAGLIQECRVEGDAETRWFVDFAMELDDDGFEVTAFGQGFMSMAAPTLEFETLVKSGRLHHGGHPVARWMASNVSVKIDAAGNMKPDKEKSSDKIDIIVGAIMGLARAMQSDIGSNYEESGLMFA